MKAMLSDIEDFDNIQPARILIWLLKLSGMWTFNGKSWNPIYRLYGWILHFHFTFLFILGMYVNAGTAQTLNDLSDALYMSLTETALMAKVLNAMRKCERTVNFLEAFEKYAEGKPKTQEEINIVKKAHVGYRRLRNSFISGSITVITISYFTPLVDNSYKLPFPCWIPFEYRNPQKYIYAWAFVSIGITITAISNFTMDLFQSFLLLQLSIYYKILGNRLQNLGHNGINDDKTLNRYFDFHSFITSLTNDCENYISLPVLVQMVLSAFVICFTVYRLQNMNFLENPSAFAMFLIFALIMALQIYLPCNYGNELTTSANELTNAIYSSAWIYMPLDSRKKIFIFMEFLKQPVVVRAGKMFNIGLNVFSQIMNNAYRLYALLLNMET